VLYSQEFIYHYFYYELLARVYNKNSRGECLTTIYSTKSLGILEGISYFGRIKALSFLAPIVLTTFNTYQRISVFSNTVICSKIPSSDFAQAALAS